MLRVIAFISLLLSIPTHGCEKQYTFQVGPFFSTTMSVQIWGEFTKEVRRLTQCDIQLISAPSFEEYISQIIHHEHDLYVTPEGYGPSVVKRGLSPILQTQAGITGYIVSRIDIHKNKALFSGTHLVTPSPYTRMYLEAKEWLNKHGLSDTVTLTFSSSHDASILALLNKEAESTAVIDNIYRKLPESIKSNLYTYKLPDIGGGIVSGYKIPPNIRSALIKAKGKIKLSKWRKVYKVKPGKFNDEFEAMFREIELNSKKP